MDGEPQPGGDELDRALFSLKLIWLGLLSGALTIAGVFAAIVASGGGPNADLGELRYLFLLPAPFHPPSPKEAPGAHARRGMVLLFPVDSDALGLALRPLGLGHGDRQHAILEARLNLVPVDFGT